MDGLQPLNAPSPQNTSNCYPKGGPVYQKVVHFKGSCETLRGLGRILERCKLLTASRVYITISNSSNPPLVFRLGSVNTDEVPYYLNGARGKFGEHEKRVRVPRGDSRSNSNLLSAREISQMYDNSIQCNSAQLKALTNCFITLPVEMCIQTDAKTCAKRNTGDAIS